MLNNFKIQSLSKNVKFNYFKGVSKFFFAAQAEKLPTLEGKPTDLKSSSHVETRAVQPWVEVENRLGRLRGELVLSDHGKIENYTLGVFKGYFRTTYRDGLTLESKIADHGLDSLDAIELGMILEDELGYIIEAETLPQFTKVKHFSNYIKQIEAYKKEHVMLPQERAQSTTEENWDTWIPFGEKLKGKLYGLTKEKNGKDKKDSAQH
jgi:acyl carrier protein